MSINTKLFTFCLAFFLLAAGLAYTSYRMSTTAPGLGAEGSSSPRLALDPLYEAQRRAGLMAADFEGDAKDPFFSEAERSRLREALRRTVADLVAARAAAVSPEAQAALDGLVAEFRPLDAADGDLTRRLLLRKLAASGEAFERAMAVSWSDAEAAGRQMEGLVAQYLWQGMAAAAASLSAVLVGAVWMSRTLVGRVGQSRKVAEAIAEGNLDVDIPAQSSKDFESLFAALRKIRASVVEHTRRHETLLMLQASSFDTTIETQHHRFVAAVNNMSQGLCMLDKDHNLVAFNDPFSALFPHFKKGATADDVQSDPRFHAFLAPHRTGTFVQEMPDGRMLQVKRRGVRGGGLVMTFEDITDQYHTSQKLEHLAGHDGLTDLPNRRLFRERLAQILADKERSQPLAVFALDLDGFKSINDTFGHPLGDALLVAVSQRLTECVGPKVFVARLGGDEFALLYTDDAPLKLAEILLAGFAESFEVDGRPLQVGVSMGIVAFGEGAARGVSPDIVMQNCDLALYRAKAEGRGVYRVYEPQMREAIQVRRMLETDLRRALDRGELELHYQPFVNVDARAISGFEALLRWRHPVRGMVSPAEFIPIAEELGLINEIGIWALGEACMEAARWPSDLTISVNLSPVQFREARLLDSVVAALDRSRLDPRRLQLEVTESLFLDNGENILSVLTALRALGSVISMDDFGTGYSSLGYLTRFPFDKIKIDQSFVREIKKPESMAVIRAVLGLSRSMKMAVIAEGIETAEQYEMLHREGCREMQGYLFGRPRAAADLPQLLLNLPRRWDALTGGLIVPRPSRTQAA